MVAKKVAHSLVMFGGGGGCVVNVFTIVIFRFVSITFKVKILVLQH